MDLVYRGEKWIFSNLSSIFVFVGRKEKIYLNLCDMKFLGVFKGGGDMVCFDWYLGNLGYIFVYFFMGIVVLE